MQIRITQDGRDVPYVVESKARDIVAWEGAGRGRTISDFKNPSMTAIYELAHITAMRLGAFAGPLASFVATCDVEVMGDEDSDPTPAPAP